MAYKCPRCGKYKVEKKTDICVMCRLQMEEGIPLQENTAAKKAPKKQEKSKSAKIKPEKKEIPKETAADRRGKRKPAEGSTRNMETVQSEDHSKEDKISREYFKENKRSQDHIKENIDQPKYSPETVSVSDNTDDPDRFYHEYFASPRRSDSRSSVDAFDKLQQEAVKEKETSAAPAPKIGSPTVRGVVRNVSVQNESGSLLLRWVRGMFTSHTFTFSGQYVTFQIFPNYETDILGSGTGSGDQCCIYGSGSTGYLSDHNVVEVWGSRNLSNVIVVRRIKNISNNTDIHPRGRIPRTVQWFLLALIVFGICSINWGGIISSVLSWALPKIILVVIILAIFRYIRRHFFHH